MNRLMWACASLCALMLVPGVGLAKKKANPVKVWVKHCAGDSDKIRIDGYNGRDGARITETSSDKIKKKGGTARLTCRGQGKGLCWLRVHVTAWNGDTAKVMKKLRKGKWLRIKTKHDAANHRLKIIAERYDSEPGCVDRPSPDPGGGPAGGGNNNGSGSGGPAGGGNNNSGSGTGGRPF
ncbi:MAG: hypothetical protein ACE366_04555 [Bradymonadia bacterium]